MQELPMIKLSLKQAQREWELLLKVVNNWEDAAKFLDNLEIR